MAVTVALPLRVIPFPATQRSVLERVRSEDARCGGWRSTTWRRRVLKPSYHYLRLQLGICAGRRGGRRAGVFTPPSRSTTGTV